MIRKAGLWWMREGRVLLCRTRKQSGLLILPGGKIEPGESPAQALYRELAEELGGLTVGPAALLGEYTGQSANKDAPIHIWLFEARVEGDPFPQAEIRELVWFDPGTDDWSRLAPSIRNLILPDLLRRGLVGARQHRE